jgi:hypothetical protein
MEPTEEKTDNVLGLRVVKNLAYTNNITLFHAALAARPPSGGSVSWCPRRAARCERRRRRGHHSAAAIGVFILRWLSYGGGGYSRRQLVQFLMRFPA